MRRRLITALAGALTAVIALAACDAGGRTVDRASGSSRSVVPSAISATEGAPATPPTLSEAPSAAAGSNPSAPSSSSSASSPAAAPTTARTTTPKASPTPSASTLTALALPPFTPSVHPVTAADLGASWHVGCPVGPEQLREISLDYWGFDNAPHVGQIVVNANAVSAVEAVFKTLYLERFPIRSMRPVSEFGGSDDASMAADNTSAFNCRNAVAAGAPRWSAHAYGQAVDVNTVENPYLEGGQVLPPQGAPFAKRSPYRAGMAVPGGQLVKAFAAVGWQWGGRWTGSPDYQHFSSTGG